ncbi:MAG TPA: flagellar brake domain-containing protein [Desulfitobacteriaceae bacterium]|nr:flagellar brake domain-containing protein [Desulfitobacteriaceae bacterium]
MTFKDKLFPGAAVKLKISEGEYQGNYQTRVDKVEGNTLSIGAPYYQGSILPLRAGTAFEIYFHDENSAYIFSTVIQERTAIPIPVFILDFPDNIRKIQRRNFVRISDDSPLEYQAVRANCLSDPKHGNLLDISGGGLYFRTEEKIEQDSRLYLQLKLPCGQINTFARVLRVQALENNVYHSVSAEFQNISENERDSIIRHIFNKQRIMRQKGLL